MHTLRDSLEFKLYHRFYLISNWKRRMTVSQISFPRFCEETWGKASCFVQDHRLDWEQWVAFVCLGRGQYQVFPNHMFSLQVYQDFCKLSSHVFSSWEEDQRSQLRSQHLTWQRAIRLAKEFSQGKVNYRKLLFSESLEVGDLFRCLLALRWGWEIPYNWLVGATLHLSRFPWIYLRSWVPYFTEAIIRTLEERQYDIIPCTEAGISILWGDKEKGSVRESGGDS